MASSSLESSFSFLVTFIIASVTCCHGNNHYFSFFCAFTAMYPTGLLLLWVLDNAVLHLPSCCHEHPATKEHGDAPQSKQGGAASPRLH